MKKPIIFILLIIFFVFNVSCQVQNIDQPTNAKITPTTKQYVVDTIEMAPSMTAIAVIGAPTPFATTRVSPIRTKTDIPTLSPTKATWAIWTPEALAPLSTAKSNVAELLKTNGGCSLPCWWGIEPGQTDFAGAFKRLSPLTTFIAVKKNDDMGGLDAEMRFPMPENNPNRELTITLKVKKEIIQQIEVSPGSGSQYHFSQLLKDYGNPEEVWVEGLIDPTSNNPFTILFYYPQKGIVATFWADAIDQGEKLQVCPGAISPILLVLWEPDGKESFIDFTEKTYGLAYIKEEKRSLFLLEQVTRQTLLEISRNNCFITPKIIWPVR